MQIHQELDRARTLLDQSEKEFSPLVKISKLIQGLGILEDLIEGNDNISLRDKDLMYNLRNIYIKKFWEQLPSMKPITPNFLKQIIGLFCIDLYEELEKVGITQTELAEKLAALIPQTFVRN